MKKLMITACAVTVSILAVSQNVPEPKVPPLVFKQVPIAPVSPAAPLALVPPSEVNLPLHEAPIPESFEETISDDYKAFLKKNPSVRSLGWTKTSVIVKLKSGKD